MTTDLEKLGDGITAASGFQVGAVHCGIKHEGLDLAVIVSDAPVSTAAVFTTNMAVAAPVVVCREHLARSGGIARAIAVNSGCANACTGAAGLAVAREMAAAAAGAAGCEPDHALVASTGVIGEPLDLSKVSVGIGAAFRALGRHTHHAAAQAIMTTDPWPKEAVVRATTPAGPFVVGGMVKGGRDDRAEHGHDARVLDDRCGGRSANPAPGVGRGHRRHLQRDHGRWGVFDERLGLPHGQRCERCGDRRGDVRRVCHRTPGGLRPTGPRDRARW